MTAKIIMANAWRDVGSREARQTAAKMAAFNENASETLERRERGRWEGGRWEGGREEGREGGRGREGGKKKMEKKRGSKDINIDGNICS